MKCPIDNTDLQMTERQGVEIDYCPKCRGVWLDRGELDKIIERSEQGTQGQTPRDVNRYQQDQDEYNRGDARQGHKKRKGGFLGDLFEFGD